MAEQDRADRRIAVIVARAAQAPADQYKRILKELG